MCLCEGRRGVCVRTGGVCLRVCDRRCRCMSVCEERQAVCQRVREHRRGVRERTGGVSMSGCFCVTVYTHKRVCLRVSTGRECVCL